MCIKLKKDKDYESYREAYEQAFKTKDKVVKNKAEPRQGLASSMIGLGLTAMLGSVMIGGMSNKMFGNKDISVRDLVTGMIDGFQVYIEEQREKIDERNKEIQDLQSKLRQKQDHYNEMSEVAEKLRQEVTKWRSKYMKMVSKSRKR